MRTKRLTITELEQIRRRAEAATPSPWDIADTTDGAIVLDSEGFELSTALNVGTAKFVRSSRQDVPALLTEVETLITEKAAARRMLDELIGEMANAAEAGYALAPETVRSELEKIRKELIDHGE